MEPLAKVDEICIGYDEWAMTEEEEEEEEEEEKQGTCTEKRCGH